MKTVSNGAQTFAYRVDRYGQRKPARLSARLTSASAYVPAPLTAIAADGWQATYDGTPPSTVIESWFNDITRAGFDATGAATTYHDRIYVTKRVRQPYPNHASLTADTVALSELICSTDVVAGVTNNSTKVSPKPIANWALPDRQVVGNSITVEVVAAHYNGRNNSQVACVVFRATDGTGTVTATAAGTVVSGRSSDQNPVLVYRATLDITSLDAGVITVNAKVYPWIGEAASVLDSADQSARREFSPRYFLKDVTRFTSPPCAYVTSAGNDGTGVWSTTAGTAEASPFLTVQGAINAAAAQMPAGDYLTGTGTSRPIDGAIIRVGSGTFVLTSAASARPQILGAPIITRDPNVSRASSIVSLGLAHWRPRLGVGTLDAAVTEGTVVLRDISILRTGANTFLGEAATPLYVAFDDVDLDNGSYSATIMSNSHIGVYGMALTNSASSFASPGTGEWRIWRGVSGDLGHNNIEGWLVLGCTLGEVARCARNTVLPRSHSGAIIAFNKFLRRTSNNSLFVMGESADVTGLAIVQNVIEYIGTGTGPNMQVGGDGDTGNVTHLVHIHNIYTGVESVGRSNMLYNETSGTPRTHSYIRDAGTIPVALNTKHDIFMADGARTQSWEYLYGVGSLGNFTQFRDADSGGFAQEYPGLLSVVGTSNTVRNDPLFVDYQGTTSGPTAGAGNGDYTLQSGSPAKELVPYAFLSHDLAGTARGTPVLDTASTYEPSGAYTL